MPAKLRNPKHRSAQDEAPLAAWTMKFTTGHDYFDDLRPYGIDDRDRAVIAEAWARLGPMFLAHWPQIREEFYPGEDATDEPWALIELGEPRR